MSGFIVGDEEVEKELLEEREQRQRDAKKIKKKKLKRRANIDELDEEDFEVINENAGLNERRQKKGRLRKIAAVEAEEEQLNGSLPVKTEQDGKSEVDAMKFDEQCSV